jgi:hypothetical protein
MSTNSPETKETPDSILNDIEKLAKRMKSTVLHLTGIST